jgi:hypothetical protein
MFLATSYHGTEWIIPRRNKRAVSMFALLRPVSSYRRIYRIRNQAACLDNQVMFEQNEDMRCMVEKFAERCERWQSL